MTQRVTTGRHFFYAEGAEPSPPTIIIDCVPLPLRARAPYFARGVDMVVSPRRRVPPEALSPNAKTLNYLNMMIAQREVSDTSPGAWALMCDRNGNLAEGAGCNIFFVKNGEVHTPKADCFLNGLTRQTVIGMLKDMQVKVHERHIMPDELESFEQCWLTGTAAEVTPVGQIGDYAFEVGALTQRVASEYEKLVRN